jgi:NitT/TauT family transport system substrate-binding protein
MLKEGKVDLITAVAPFGFDPELQAFSHPLFTQEEAVGRTQMIVVVARKGFIDKNRAALVDFLEDYVAATRYLLDPAHRAEVVNLVTEVTKQKPDLYESWVFTKQDYYRDPDGLPNLRALQANVDLAKQLGFLRSGLDVAKYADLSLVQDAAKRLAGGASH